MGIAGRPVQVRNHDAANLKVAEGPYLSSDLPIAGFALIEAADLDAALEIAKDVPARFGGVEVRPVRDMS
jgi:hypothetical protein